MIRVAITGIGIISCLGNGIDEVSGALRAGRSGVVVDESRRDAGFRSPLTGMIRDFDPTRYLSRKQRKTMPDFAVQTYAAVKEALRCARLSSADLQNRLTGLIFGCDSSCCAAVEQADLLRQHGSTRSIGSGLVFRSMTSSITMNLNVLLRTRGACWTISSACSSSGHAIGQAAALIAQGLQERIICGGAQEINSLSMCSFDALGAFSNRVDDPTAASRPFDRYRDGLVPSGGAAALVLESIESARRRGARILGEVLGYGFSSDGAHISMTKPEGLASAMLSALYAARLDPSAIDYICAHATSTSVGDASEAQSIRAVFGENAPYVSSLKSMTGHELWMSGASAVVYCAIMARDGFIAPNLNFSCPDEHSKHLNIVTEVVEKAPSCVLCNAAGFGGTNSSLVLRFGHQGYGS